jgi:hypothetical protein
LPGCSDGEIALLASSLGRPVEGDLRELLRATKGAHFDRTLPWDQYHVIPPEVPLELDMAMAEIRDPDRCIDVGDCPLLSAVDNVFVVQDSCGAIVQCEPGGHRDWMFDNVRSLLETITQAHEHGVFVAQADETIRCDVAAYRKLAARLNPACAHWRS